ncbi:MAG TPA: hypothetical protein VGQ06_01305 [Gemmatimonadales bacterium]|jgi:hypothetical protein|nr:hypothetical protein [Gemmatimonadales bacterium]
MLKRILGIAAALVVPTLLAAQTPIPANEHASATAKSKTIPAAQASATAKAKVAEAMARRATRVRGQAVGLDNRPVTPATRAKRATPAQPGAGEGGRAIPATRAEPATPASPSQKPADAGTGHGRRP